MKDSETRLEFLLLLLALTACGSGAGTSSKTAGVGDSPVEVAATNPGIQRGMHPRPDEGEMPRLAEWPTRGSRFRLQTEVEGSLDFARAPVVHETQPEAVDCLSVGEEWLVFRVGPVGEWYANETLYILVASETHEVHAAGIYMHSDVGGMGGWGTVEGSVLTDPSLPPGEGKLRCSYELSERGSGGEPWFTGTFELSTTPASESLRHDLNSFGVQIPE